jgi:hypothetical protein
MFPRTESSMSWSRAVARWHAKGVSTWTVITSVHCLGAAHYELVLLELAVLDMMNMNRQRPIMKPMPDTPIDILPRRRAPSWSSSFFLSALTWITTYQHCMRQQHAIIWSVYLECLVKRKTNSAYAWRQVLWHGRLYCHGKLPPRSYMIYTVISPFLNMTSDWKRCTIRSQILSEWNSRLSVKSRKIIVRLIDLPQWCVGAGNLLNRMTNIEVGRTRPLLVSLQMKVRCLMWWHYAWISLMRRGL